MSTLKRKVPAVAVVLVLCVLVLFHYDLTLFSGVAVEDNQEHADGNDVVGNDVVASSFSAQRGPERKHGESPTLEEQADNNAVARSESDEERMAEASSFEPDDTDGGDPSPPLIVDNAITEAMGDDQGDEVQSQSQSNTIVDQKQQDDETILTTKDAPLVVDPPGADNASTDNDTMIRATNISEPVEHGGKTEFSVAMNDTDTQVSSVDSDTKTKETEPIVVDDEPGDGGNEPAKPTEPLDADNATEDDSANMATRAKNISEALEDDDRTTISRNANDTHISPLDADAESNVTGIVAASPSSKSNVTNHSGSSNESFSILSTPPFVASSDDPAPTHDAPFEWAACLLIRDDNKILPEWLAYHYETLPLRRLVIALDPSSDTDGTPIYDAYRSIGLNISIWHDEDYFYNGLRLNDRVVPANASVNDKRESYLWRQKIFLSACTRQFKRENRTWVLLVDTDEYLAYHHYDPGEGVPFPCGELKSEEAVEECTASYHRNQSSPSTGDIRTRLPVFGTPNSTLAHFLQSQLDYLIRDNNWNKLPCWVLPRSQWGAQEADPDDYASLQKTYLKLGLNISNFHTLRFRKHGMMQNKLPGKPIVDVSRYDPFRYNVSNPHRPYRGSNLCKGGPFVKAFDNVFRVHHYTGTAEVFLSRPGREIHMFMERQPEVVGKDDGVVGWLESFARRVGKDRAKQLTEGLRAWAFETDGQIYAEIERKMESDPEYAKLRDYRVKSDMIAEIESPKRRRILSERLERLYRYR